MELLNLSVGCIFPAPLPTLQHFASFLCRKPGMGSVSAAGSTALAGCLCYRTEGPYGRRGRLPPSRAMDVGDGCGVLEAVGPVVQGIHGWFCAAQVVSGWLEGTSWWGVVLPAGTRKRHRARAAGRRMRPVLSNVSPYLGISLITSYLLFPKKKRRDQGWTEMLKSCLNSILFELRDL